MDTVSVEREEVAGSLPPPATKGLILLGCYKGVFLCREQEPEGRLVTFKTNKKDGIPGSIITVNPTEEIKRAKYPEISGTLVSVRYCARDLGLKPIPIANYGKWSPNDECYGKNGEPIPEWFKPIANKGKRTKLCFEPTGPFGDPMGMASVMKSSLSLQDFHKNFYQAPGTLLGPPDTNPINKANELIEDDDIKGARRILYDLLAEDLRCLDAHACLGEIELDRNLQKALRHYEMGVSIAQLSLENEDPDPVISWLYLENRPFLKCFYGTGVCAWKSGNLRLAKEIFLKLLSYNPRDNQGVRMLLPHIDKGRTYDDYFQTLLNAYEF